MAVSSRTGRVGYKQLVLMVAVLTGIMIMGMKEAQGVVIFPKLTKGAFVFGLEGGNGVLIVRDGKTGSWSAPAFYEISAASFGVQAGM